MVVPRRTAVGVRFNHNTRLCEVRRRQRRDGSKLTVFLRSSSIGPKSSARSGRTRRRWAFCRPPRGYGSRRTWSCGLWRHCTAARRTGRPCGSSDSRCRHPRPPPQNRRRACALPRSGRPWCRPDLRSGCRQSTGNRRRHPDARRRCPPASRRPRIHKYDGS